MKYKKDTSNVKAVNKPSKSPSSSDDSCKNLKDTKPQVNEHQDIVKRLMTHSQYFPSNPNSKTVPVTYSNQPTYHHTPYSVAAHYPTYNHQVPPVYESQQFNEYYTKDFYYQPPQQSYNHFSNINTCLTSPSLSSPSTHNNFDQISNGSPRSNYVFNGDFTLNFNADFDGSFPLIDAAKTEQLFDNQAPVEIKSFEAASNIELVTQATIGSHEIKSSFDDVKSLVNLSDDDVLSIGSRSSRPSPSAALDWKFTEHQWRWKVLFNWRQ